MHLQVLYVTHDTVELGSNEYCTIVICCDYCYIVGIGFADERRIHVAERDS